MNSLPLAIGLRHCCQSERRLWLRASVATLSGSSAIQPVVAKKQGCAEICSQRLALAFRFKGSCVAPLDTSFQGRSHRDRAAARQHRYFCRPAEGSARSVEFNNI